MHSDKVKATAKRMGLSMGGPTPMTGSASKRDRDPRKQDRKKPSQGKAKYASGVNPKAKSTTKY